MSEWQQRRELQGGGHIHGDHQLRLHEEKGLFHGCISRHHPTANERVRELGVDVGRAVVDIPVHDLHLAQRLLVPLPLPGQGSLFEPKSLEGYDVVRSLGNAVPRKGPKIVEERHG